MRLLERMLQRIEIAPRQTVTDSLGGVTESFSADRRSVRASVIPSTGGVMDREAGVVRVQTMCLLMPADTRIDAGDGVCVGSDAPQWRCVCVQKWSEHVAAQVERIC